jgi:UDP-N-acetylglucosamine 4,6-dehydratase/5-epimerase
MKDFMKNKTILLTGGTGSFGTHFIYKTIQKYKPKQIIVFSRDEMKQWDLQNKLSKYSKLIKFTIGDVRDKNKVNQVMKNVDIVVHAAATKIVTSAEKNPFETIKTNILGAVNIIEASIYNNVKKVIALSTDKACNPVNLYGATKLASDKLFVSSNFSDQISSTCFSVVRYGNVMGSRGSIIPFFLSHKNKKIFPITDIEMTRFMISLDEGVELVWKAISESVGGEIFIKKIPSMKITDIAKSISPNCKFDVIGIRPGEKIHEEMISEADSYNTYEYRDYFKIIPHKDFLTTKMRSKLISNGVKVKKGFVYSSNGNNEWMTKDYLSKWIKKNI